MSGAKHPILSQHRGRSGIMHPPNAGNSNGGGRGDNTNTWRTSGWNRGDGGGATTRSNRSGSASDSQAAGSTPSASGGRGRGRGNSRLGRGRGGSGPRGRGHGGGDSIRHPTFGPAASVSSVNAFIQHLQSRACNRGESISQLLDSNRELWYQCWRSYEQIKCRQLQVLAVTLAKLPFSSTLEPPPVDACSGLVEKFLYESACDEEVDSGNYDNAIVSAVEIALNVTQRLLKFEWENAREDVSNALFSILGAAESILDNRKPEHRKIKAKITAAYDELDKPWSIKVKAIALDLLDPTAMPIVSSENPNTIRKDATKEPLAVALSWKSATVEWLSRPEVFQPIFLPTMKVPGGPGNGVYSSKEEYFDIVMRLWVAMTFGDGNNLLSPLCNHREGGSGGPGGDRGKDCGKAMWPLKGLCGPCAEKTRRALRSGPGDHASTHIYDGTITRIGYDGKLFLDKVVSRRPPKQTQIHWKTTSRLQSPNLAGLVKLTSRGMALKPENPIIWVEITNHGNPKDEFKELASGRLAVTLIDASDKVFWLIDQLGLARGDAVAVLDCQTFAPEHVPILNALEAQSLRTLPFADGALLNLRDVKSITTENHLIEDIDEGIACEMDEGLPDIKGIIVELVKTSTFEPIVQIRRGEKVCANLIRSLQTLVERATLDAGQLESFVGALKYPVHCTQGPPGTGKSYLGVVLVRALLIIRNLWIAEVPSAGSPPILVLSYKNHAIDEFLSDLVKAESTSSGGLSMIRIGSSQEESLKKYTEHEYSRESLDVVTAKRRLKEIHLILDNLAGELSGKVAEVAAVRFEALAGESDIVGEGVKKEAKKRLVAAAVTVELFIQFLMSMMPTNENDPLSFLKMLDSETPAVPNEHLLKAVNSFLQGARQSKLDLKSLQEGIKHYGGSYPAGEIIHRFLMGFKPRPICSFTNEDADDDKCIEIATNTSLFCSNHQCWFGIDEDEQDIESSARCTNRALDEFSYYCGLHNCNDSECFEAKMPEQEWCEWHACFVCVDDGKQAGRAIEDPPRNACIDHVLCSAQDAREGGFCRHVTVENSVYCKDHISLRCTATGCKGFRVSPDNPFCKSHLVKKSGAWGSGSWVTANSTKIPVPNQVTNHGKEEFRQCMAVTTKGKRCKGIPEALKLFCSDHREYKGELAIVTIPKVNPVISGETHKKIEEPQQIITDQTEQPPTLCQKEQSVNSVPSCIEDDISDFSMLSGDDEDIVEKPAIGDLNLDEFEESGNTQHLRDVYQFEDRSIYEMEAVQEEEKEDDLTENVAQLENEDEALRFEISNDSVLPRNWSWDYDLPKRWAVCERLIHIGNKIYLKAVYLIKRELDLARKEFHLASVRASAKAYEGKSIIGGTMVGCIKRLEAIRSTNPFAIVVEEASEVLEPLLFSCICPTTCKLEMIGDHLQLQPSMMGKFEFEKRNRVNVSMFERLICAPKDHKVPSSVLSTQRRMRKNICDLTRDFYLDITDITDEGCTKTKVIGGSLVVKRRLRYSDPFFVDAGAKKMSMWAGKGREIPGILPHVFFWTHFGKQQKARKGLSRINDQEATMVCALAKYLHSNGVPKACMTILTPYKGQLMEIREKLKPLKLFDFAPGSDNIGLSTVDRFQGDENDVIIISMVLDENSRTEFVKLVNRMIVLLSRARLGLFIIGNTSYFENEKNRAEHWTQTIQRLSRPAPSDSSSLHESVEVYNGIRIGPEIPLCCAIHRGSRKMVASAKDLKSGFCKTICDVQLSCGHPCNKSCHWPVLIHNDNCQIEVNSPCHKHPQVLKCSDIFKSLPEHLRAKGIDDVILHYECKAQVDVQLPCTHIIGMDCKVEMDIIASKAKYPGCRRPNIVPFVHAECKHELNGDCSVIRNYIQNPASAPKCSKNVDYLPLCGHGVNVACYLARQYDNKSAIFICALQVELRLPRCGHLRSLPCLEAVKLKTWSGQRLGSDGVVHQGQTYGPPDYDCNNMIQFQRKCGHTSTVECRNAFKLAASHTYCTEKILGRNPICGHSLLLPCHEKDALLARGIRERTTPIEEFNEGEALPVTDPNLLSIACTSKILLRRKCGHSHHMTCSAALAGRQLCTEKIEIRSPVCGHQIIVPCHYRQIESLKPYAGILGYESEELKSLLNKGIIFDDMPSPAEVKELSLIKCQETVTVERRSCCNHSMTMKCNEVFSVLRERLHGKSADFRKCETVMEKSLPCGHTLRLKCCDESSSSAPPKCQEKSSKPCLNYERCRNLVMVSCSSTDIPQCKSEFEWTCRKGHTVSLICANGIPSDCRACIAEDVDIELTRLSNIDPDDPAEETMIPLMKLPFDFPSCDVEMLLTSDTLKQYIEACGMVVNFFKEFLGSIESDGKIATPLFNPFTIRCFRKCDQNKALRNPQQIKTKTLKGLQLTEWTSANLTKLMESMEKDSEVSILIGVAYACYILVDPVNVPQQNGNATQQSTRGRRRPRNSKGPQSQREWANPELKTYETEISEWVNKQKSLGFQAVQQRKGGQDLITLWDPYCVCTTHKVTFTKRELTQVITELKAEERIHGRVVFKPKYIEYVKHKYRPLEASLTRTPQHMTIVKSCLKETIAAGISLLPFWDEESILDEKAVPEVVENLKKKLAFVIAATKGGETSSPFSGVNYLQQLKSKSEPRVALGCELLECLELLEINRSLGTNLEEAERSLERYIDGVRMAGIEAHPFLLVALGRIGTKRKIDYAGNHFKTFETLYPQAASTWLWKEERGSGASSNSLGSKRLSVSETSSEAPRRQWEDLKTSSGCQSAAMEKLLDLTGLKKVKIAAITLFKSGLARQKVSEDKRRSLVYSLNYCFMGNPGCGKTTVARYFAEILRDSKFRTKSTFIECSAQDLKEEGLDKFKQKIQAAMDGDEAYLLAPKEDFKGKPIVAELLTAAENHRDRISFILAGYEGDMHEKLYSYNDGLRSRFTEVMFDDFDSQDLMAVWAGILKENGWEESGESVGKILIGRLSKMAGRKGFGNARAVRKAFEDATMKAMSRPDFNGDLVLRIEDIMGEHPINNPKLKAVLSSFEERIGWGSIKKAVASFVSVCENNYERELKGLLPIPIVLNRIFVGSPGTGKTTCAELYGKLLKELNFLSKGDVVKKTASDFVGGHVGESQTKTNAIIEQAKGKVLIIDEAYNLDDSLYGKQVLDVIVEKIQGTPNDDIAVIMLGYKDRMLKMLRDQNPGLARRFPADQAFEFEDYSDTELLKIWQLNCIRENVVAPTTVAQRALEILSNQRLLSNFGNAGAVESLLRSAVARATSRIKPGEPIRLCVEDLEARLNDNATDPYAPLKKLYRMEEIEERIRRLEANFEVAKNEGSGAPDLGHFVFTGNPGTGKTTVARVVAKILYNLKIIGSDRLVETHGLGLTGEYIGQTKKKVEEKLQEAKGGCLFIDEAYELGKGHYATEAVTTLVAAMTDPEYKGVVIIIAGYENEIQGMLETNPGLKSRFKHFFAFPDWQPEDCIEFLEKRIAAESFTVESADDAMDIIFTGIEELRSLSGWANARDVLQIWDEILQNRAVRVYKAPEMQRTIAIKDVIAAIEMILKVRRSSPMRDEQSWKKPQLEMELGPMMPMMPQHAMAPPPHTQVMSSLDSEVEMQDVEQEHASEDIMELAETIQEDAGRDPGVSDSDWEELCRAKEEYAQRMEEIKKEIEDEQKRAELEKRLREEQKMKERLRLIGLCPAGYQWFRVGGNGWRCGGGSHFASDEMINKQFSFDA
ncbi:hypothetical protein HDU67_008904 [Dinochytrium kinnereticum]|nr:hypothetical protein HDU67_008904 [Dinochytrium kinnereticum]